MKKSEEQIHTHPKKAPPRHDLRKIRTLPDPDLNDADPDLVKALVEDDFNELKERELDKRDDILSELPTPNPKELKQGQI